jgi:hypothetical protein
VYGAGRDRPRQCAGAVARADRQDTGFPGVVLPRAGDISFSSIYLITWRVARRFGWRGLAVFIGAVAVIGPPRDYLIAATFPEWMVFAPGVAPIVADAATYVGIVALGHAVMRLIAGPAREDRLARRPWTA